MVALIIYLLGVLAFWCYAIYHVKTDKTCTEVKVAHIVLTLLFSSTSWAGIVAIVLTLNWDKVIYRKKEKQNVWC